MAVISKQDYLRIAQDYSASREVLTSTDAYLYDAVYTIVMSNDIPISADLVSQLNTSYLQNVSVSSIPQYYIDAVRSVHRHIISRGGFADIDAYLETTTLNGNTVEAIQVPAAWAEISDKAGYVIDAANIE